MASRLHPPAGRLLLAGGFAAAFALSAVSDPRALAVAGLAVAALFPRGLARNAGRALRSVLPVAGGLALAGAAWLRISTGSWPSASPFLALVLRATIIALLSCCLLDRVDLLRALAPFPAASRLLVVTLAQIHALRLVATDSLDGLRSRLPRKPGAVDAVRSAGGVTGALFTLSARNAREVSEALRARGF